LPGERKPVIRDGVNNANNNNNNNNNNMPTNLMKDTP
jgi:hypothetical protein